MRNDDFAEGSAVFLISSLIFLFWFMKRHWKLFGLGFIAFLLWRHHIGAN
jgi:hypothetical protein